MKTINKDRLKFLYDRARYECKLSPNNVVFVRSEDLLTIIHELKARRKMCSKPRGGKDGIQKE